MFQPAADDGWVIRDHRVVAQALLVERASSGVVSAMKHAGVRPILLKGPLQQWWLESEGSPRASVDVDILVEQGQLDGASDALAELGYSRRVALPDEPGHEHSTVWVSGGQIPVELHWSLVGVDDHKIWDLLSRETEIAVVGGEEVEIPNEAARCMIVCLQAAQHGIGQPLIFNDLERALVIANTDTWRRATGLARAAGGWVPFAAALSLTSRGQELLDELGATVPALSERQALSLLTPAPTARGFYFLSRERGARAKAAFVASKLAPPPTFMRLRYPIARRGTAGLALAYLYRPVWLVRWSFPGLRSWHKARQFAKVGNESAASPSRSSAQ